MARQTSVAPFVFIAPFAVIFAGMFLVPIAYALVSSFFRVTRSGLGFGPATTTFVGFANYLRALSDSAFLQGVGRVLAYGIVQVPVMLIFAAFLALALDSGAVFLRRTFRTVAFAPYAVPGVVAALLWGFMFNPNFSPVIQFLHTISVNAPDFLGRNLILWSLANIGVWQWTGFNMIILLASLQAIPSELHEAASLDGCGELRIAWSIKLPMIRPALILTLLFSIIGTLQLYSEPKVLAAITPNISSSYTPNIYTSAVAFAENDGNYAAALAVTLALGTFVLSFGLLALTRRQAGLTATGTERR